MEGKKMSPTWTDPDGNKCYVDHNVTSHDQIMAWIDEQNNKTEMNLGKIKEVRILPTYMLPKGSRIKRCKHDSGTWSEVTTTKIAYYREDEVERCCPHHRQIYRIRIPDPTYTYIEVKAEHLLDRCKVCGGPEYLGGGNTCSNCKSIGYVPIINK